MLAMDGYCTHGRAAVGRIRRCWCCFVPLFAIGWAAIASGSGGIPIQVTLRTDASLADVFFTDELNGWAVGDRGVIWHTEDGGTTWTQQESNVTCRLNSVFFTDRNCGWIVGGESRPYSRATRGVVLRTENGGASWVSVPGLLLPLLTRVKFFDENVGITTGIGNQSQPSGVFVTRDGGQSWQALSADQAGCWLASDFLTTDTGAVAGPDGRFATLARHQIVHSPMATPSLRSFHALRLIAPAGGWIVGDGGIVMNTTDGGRSWQSAAAELPNDAAEYFDFRALAVHGQHVWIAGTPGTRVFRSEDDGRSWQAFDTGHITPIRAMAFVDAQHGWAVGDLGCILATQDSGRTWRLQRAGGRRAAMLAVFADASGVPFELIAQVGAAEGFITAVDIIDGTDDTPTGRVPITAAAAEAMLLAGAAASDIAWQFRLPADNLALAPDDLLDALNRSTDGRAIEQLQRHLVRQLRMWRPNVVVTHHAGPQTPGGLGRGSASPKNAEFLGSYPQGNSSSTAVLVENLLLHAVQAAADPAQSAELSSGTGLEPWRVDKVYGVLPAGLQGHERIDTSRFSSALRGTPADYASISRRIMQSRDAEALETIELQLLVSGVTKVSGQPGMFGGIPLSYASDARRQAPELEANDADAMRRVATRRRHLQQLLERTEGNAAWAGQVANITEGLDPLGGGELLLQLADGYRSTGNLDLAADTYFLFTRKYPDHPLVDTALIWLVQFYASGETAHRAASRGLTNVGSLAIDTGPLANEGVRQASAEMVVPNATPAVGLSHDDRRRRAVQLAEYFRTARPHLYAEPVVRFAEVTAQRQLGYPNEANRYFLSLRQLPESNSWRHCAASEDWLANPGNLPPPKAIATCRRTVSRPHLDGRLDEPFWQAADILRLRGEKPDPTSSNHSDNRTSNEVSLLVSGEVRLAYDDEFLYLAFSCPKFKGVEYLPSENARQRDADLSRYDRIELQLDLDRDFATAYRLTVDSRGWCRDACWDDVHWNPTWYIAASDREASWAVEAAIPMSELTADKPSARHVWAAGVTRTIPRVGYESWTGQLVADELPDRFGLLIFE
jgi:photosystem II stability/assembly factor-like uncharacterized protein